MSLIRLVKEPKNLFECQEIHGKFYNFAASKLFVLGNPSYLSNLVCVGETIHRAQDSMLYGGAMENPDHTKGQASVPEYNLICYMGVMSFSPIGKKRKKYSKQSLWKL